MIELTLYSRIDCPACDIAEAMLLDFGLHFDHVFIEDRLEDLAQYGSRVPVLVSQAGATLEWPWNNQALREWLSSSES